VAGKAERQLDRDGSPGLLGGRQAAATMTRRLASGLLGATLLFIAPLAARQEFMWEPPSASDFPATDSMVRSYHLTAVRARAADEAFRKEPVSARTFDLLFKSGRTADALGVLEQIVQSRPAEMHVAFRAVGYRGREIASDKAYDYAARLRAVAVAARTRLPTLPREEAARIAGELVTVESELEIETRSWRPRMEAFVAEYAGTHAALLAQVDLLGDRSGPAMLDVLDAFMRAHPGTEAAAKALYQKGFHVGHNAFSGT
jgi:hypothetical protein